MWSVLWYVGCCRVCGILYGMWAVVVYVGSCIVCVLLYYIWDAGNMGCSICGLLNDM